jgi:hypothetical protein
MTSDLSPNARRELAALAQIRGTGQAEAILISHQRRDIGSCLCGWVELGRSHAGHQVAMLSEAGLLPSPDGDREQCQAETRSWDHFGPEQVDSYWIRCTEFGQHDRHKDSHTGLRWTDSTP